VDQSEPTYVPGGGFAEWVRHAVAVGASDLHLRTNTVPYVRLNGEIVPVHEQSSPIDANTLNSLAQALIARYGSKGSAGHLETKGYVDISCEVAEVARLRVHIFRQEDVCCMSVRMLPLRAPTLAEIGMPEVVQYLARAERGLLLVTGAASSGKTTTLAAIVDHINRTSRKHIVTIEEPIEVVHRVQNSLVTQREIGRDAFDFSDALRAALREDPDVILVGEIRDAEAMQAAMSAAETGHLVLASLHTGSVEETVLRVIDLLPFSEEKQARAGLAGSLVGVISQRLVKTVNGPLVPALEILVSTSRVIDAILESGEEHRLDDVISGGGYYGMQTFDQALAGLTLAGIVNIDEAFRNASNKQALKLLLQSFGIDPGRVRPENLESSSQQATAVDALHQAAAPPPPPPAFGGTDSHQAA
jgi:twitching motility protein PilT